MKSHEISFHLHQIPLWIIMKSREIPWNSHLNKNMKSSLKAMESPHEHLHDLRIRLTSKVISLPTGTSPICPCPGYSHWDMTMENLYWCVKNAGNGNGNGGCWDWKWWLYGSFRIIPYVKRTSLSGDADGPGIFLNFCAGCENHSYTNNWNCPKPGHTHTHTHIRSQRRICGITFPHFLNIFP